MQGAHGGAQRSSARVRDASLGRAVKAMPRPFVRVFMARPGQARAACARASQRHACVCVTQFSCVIARRTAAARRSTDPSLEGGGRRGPARLLRVALFAACSRRPAATALFIVESPRARRRSPCAHMLSTNLGKRKRNERETKVVPKPWPTALEIEQHTNLREFVEGVALLVQPTRHRLLIAPVRVLPNLRPASSYSSEYGFGSGPWSIYPRKPPARRQQDLLLWKELAVHCMFVRSDRSTASNFTHVVLKDPSKPWPTAAQLESLGHTPSEHVVRIPEQSDESILVGLDYGMTNLACWDQTMIDDYYPATSGSASDLDKSLDNLLSSPGHVEDAPKSAQS